MKRIVLCADDFGQAQHISAGIVELVKLKRLSAVSCMVNTSEWPQQARWLLPFAEQIDIGLHFNLTEGSPLSADFKAMYGEVFPGLPKLLKKAFLRGLSQRAIATEYHAQIDQFEAQAGCLPHFIDGHQHTHQFPVVREALIEVYEKRLRTANTYVRLVTMQRNLALKRWIIYLSGTSALRRLLDKHKILHNQSFAGIYEFTDLGRYSELFPQFLRESRDQGIIMCHPAHQVESTSDSIAKARFEEFTYLASEQFLVDCERQKVAIQRFFCSRNLL